MAWLKASPKFNLSSTGFQTPHKINYTTQLYSDRVRHL